MSPKQRNVVKFLRTQALGVVVEDLVRVAFFKTKGEESKTES